MKSGQRRVVIENVSPEINCGQHAAKRVVSQILEVSADLLADGHDVLNAHVKYKHQSAKVWKYAPMELHENDRWAGSFKVEKQGLYVYTIEAWVDYPLTWQHNIERKIEDGQQVNVELEDGIQYLQAAKKKSKADKEYLDQLIAAFKNADDYNFAIEEAQSEKLHQVFLTNPAKQFATTYDKLLPLYVDRKKALFSSWYEFFPRSTAKEPNQHGTFKDVLEIIPLVAEQGFDVIYFPPVHPIGTAHRKGKNNTTTALPEDVGVPWAIGNKEGGHKDILPELGSLEDFQEVIKLAAEHGIEIAMDFALQCSPDHPYVKEHPSWFKWRPDGTVQYAENPPKKYQDIYPIYFESEDWENMWDEFISIVLYWNKLGIKIFRVDNPHTKPFGFWEYLIAEVKKVDQDVLFLSEAFTKPKTMQRLAKIGFTQGYTYYTWRTSKSELIEYMNELTKSPMKDYFRPNFWPNTPDINPWMLQGGNENLYITRHMMAATLSSNFGMYGPVYEQIENAAVIGKEEYLNSEKYEVRHWDWKKVTKVGQLVGKINKIRKEHKALQETNNIDFCQIENDRILAYFKQSQDKTDSMLFAVNLDPYNKQGGWVQVPKHKLGLDNNHPIRVTDLITGNSYIWNQEWNFVELDPYQIPYHIFSIHY
ncbi:MAG: alpha-1,4-glucan--maltose-1-phosphate maltosyltransferase [Roseivirga sp.]|uniref:alpha-1,4-glucan--maltose-1-phosphate maltosyltransferase n=1 Tax=Roseivirga sp. TaxID=1964215 RepID=UPI001B1A0265|nr:alpha-1,4-glucan--maltose-1-phosphate maltosyltransferase [Roseivirga sp.]MBO6660615.1 alpha-1,4-glucan--maltose-1-phosphate maltosyltransferase [Roseivirga sp.]MBO6759398.1 alpha-1,4-glucan--maltose-1-phosphate maltosyltransferase [Roseivirga sp.]MBO6906648.1 alpha-1,4-glucan--maltose-1-phosphate maltosyltransferase [Roseivirga sp.]